MEETNRTIEEKLDRLLVHAKWEKKMWSLLFFILIMMSITSIVN